MKKLTEIFWCLKIGCELTNKPPIDVSDVALELAAGGALAKLQPCGVGMSLQP